MGKADATVPVLSCHDVASAMVADPKRNELKRRVFELHKLSVQRCLEPSEECDLPAIRAHSIQNAITLDQLCSDGHVIMPRLKANAGVAFESVGRNQATTFTGLCGQHDQAIFAPIDKTAIDIRNNEHLFLLAYRSVLREVHASLTAAVKLQLGFQEKVGLGLVRGDVPTPDGLRAVGHIANSYDSYLYKREFDVAYSTRKFGRIQHVRFFEGGRLPSVAVSALFSLDEIVVGDDVARVALNVFPAAGGAMIVFSFLREHAIYIRPFLRPFKRSSGDQLLEMLSVRVLNSCENFVIAPRFWHAISDSDRSAIQDLFAESLLVDASDLGNRHITLFDRKQL
jgi:hypothetical protein